MRTVGCEADDALRIAADPLSTARTIRQKLFYLLLRDTLFPLAEGLNFVAGH